MGRGPRTVIVSLLGGPDDGSNVVVDDRTGLFVYCGHLPDVPIDLGALRETTVLEPNIAIAIYQRTSTYHLSQPVFMFVGWQ